MTFLEKAKEILKAEGKKIEDNDIMSGYCPCDFGLEDVECTKVGSVCEKCWNREMPDTEPHDELKERLELIDELKQVEYNKGLADGYNLVAKINDYTYEQLTDIFGMCSLRYILQSFTPQEAIAKLKEYEYSKIEVGDVVETIVDNEKGIVVGTRYSNDKVDIWFAGYEVPQEMSKKHIKKTGKHIDIKAILGQIGE